MGELLPLPDGLAAAAASGSFWEVDPRANLDALQLVQWRIALPGELSPAPPSQTGAACQRLFGCGAGC